MLRIADRDLATAENNLKQDLDWAFTIAYNSVLQAGRALMLHEGYRPRSGETHVIVTEFLREKLGTGYQKQINQFDQMRRKRHRLVYEITGLVSQTEAEFVIVFAKTFVQQIKEIISDQADLGL